MHRNIVVRVEPAFDRLLEQPKRRRDIAGDREALAQMERDVPIKRHVRERRQRGAGVRGSPCDALEQRHELHRVRHLRHVRLHPVRLHPGVGHPAEQRVGVPTDQWMMGLSGSSTSACSCASSPSIGRPTNQYAESRRTPAIGDSGSTSRKRLAGRDRRFALSSRLERDAPEEQGIRIASVQLQRLGEISHRVGQRTALVADEAE